MMVLFSGLAMAAQLNVPADYSIQGAIDAALDGDEIAVGPGEYDVALDLKGKTLRLYATEGPGRTLLRGTREAPVLVVQSGEGVQTSLEGFTISGGGGAERIWIVGNGWMGAGVYVYGSALTILDCVFSGNQAVVSGQSGGGGLFVMEGDVWVRESAFIENLGFYAGGGALVASGTLTIEDSVFFRNHARRGGGLAAYSGSTLTLSGNEFVGNRAGWGGALFAKDSTVYAEGERVLEHQVWRSGGAWALENSIAELSGAELTDNQARDDGGQVYLSQGSELTLRSSWLDRGAARSGGAVFMRGADTSLDGQGLVLSGNQATESGADFWVSEGRLLLRQLTSLFPQLPAEAPGALVFAQDNAQVELLNHIVFGGSGSSLVEIVSGIFSWSRGMVYDFQGELGLGGQADLIEADPVLVSTTPGALDPSLTSGSPAIDAGAEDTLDLDGSRADLGATGGLYPVTVSP